MFENYQLITMVTRGV